MARKRKLHPSLEYESRRVAEAQMQLDFTNTLMWKCDKQFSTKFVDEKVWSYGAGIEFKELLKNEFEIVKKGISEGLESKLVQFKKDSSATRLTLSQQMILGRIGDNEVTMWLSFHWGIPDSCEIVRTNKTEEVTDVFIDEDNGRIYKTRTEVEVKCNKPILEAVFHNQQKADG
tara:strand:- start:1725 stop:2246 length:522 start_codon:yes stop_codon:yes gene_type:complete